MKNQPTSRRERRLKLDDYGDWSTAGFSAVEVIIVVVILAVLLSIAVPAMGEAMRHAAVNRAVMVVQMDLQRAHSLAARQRAPVRMSFDVGNKAYTFTNAASGDTLYARSFDENTEFDLDGLFVSSTRVDIAPTGFASASLVVVVNAYGYSRAVLMMRGGAVRMIRW